MYIANCMSFNLNKAPTTGVVLEKLAVPRRFVSRFKTNSTLELEFGAGVTTATGSLPNPFNVGIGTVNGLDLLNIIYYLFAIVGGYLIIDDIIESLKIFDPATSTDEKALKKMTEVEFKTYIQDRLNSPPASKITTPENKIKVDNAIAVLKKYLLPAAGGGSRKKHRSRKHKRSHHKRSHHKRSHRKRSHHKRSHHKRSHHK